VGAGGGSTYLPRQEAYCPENSSQVDVLQILLCILPFLQFFVSHPFIRWIMSNLGLAHCVNLFCRLRGTVTGANNRLDVLSLVTCGVDENEMSSGAEVLDVTEGWEEDETHNPDIPATSHRRGMAAFVFVPFEEVCLSLILVNGRSQWKQFIQFLPKK
jgi:hypothetical protein